MTDLDLIPEHMREGVRLYLEFGIEPGSFLRAVLENNLVEAVGRADTINRECMFDWANFLYNEMPGNSWGNREKVAAWIVKRRNEKPTAKGENP